MRRGSFWLGLGMLALALVAALTVSGIAPPAVRGVDAVPTDFSATRALAHVEAIARAPHPVGSPAHEDVRAYLLATLAALGLEARVQDTRSALKAAGVTHAARVRNVIARLPGTRPGPAVMLAAHYDSVPQSHGASDDGSGVATLLETARALKAGPPLQNDVLFVFTDAEEDAGCGSLAFTRDELAKNPVGVALNFEARGTRGAVALYDTSTGNGALIDALAKVAPRVVSTSLLGTLARALPNDSDATLWKRAGIPTYAFAYVDHEYQYHQSTDDLGALDPQSLQHDGDYALPLVRYFGNATLPLPPRQSVTYFDVLGRLVVSYSTFVARLLGLGTLGLFVALLLQARRAAGVGLGGVALAGLVSLGVVVVAGLLAGVLHAALRFIVTPFVLFAHPLLATATGLAVGVAALLFFAAWRVRDEGVTRAVLGAQSLWALLLLVTTLFAPAASFVFQWPLAFAVLGTWAWLGRRGERDVRTDLAVTSTLVPTAFFWSYLGYTLFAMAGGHAPEATVVAVVFALLLALPLGARLASADLRRLGSALAWGSLVVGVGAGLLLRVRPGVPRPDSLMYNLFASRHSGTWATNDATHDAFVAQRVPPGLRTGSGDYYALPPLETEVTSVDEAASRHSTIHLASPRRARCIGIWETTHETLTRARVDGVDVVDIVRFSAETDEKIVRLFAGGATPSSWVMEYCGADEKGFTLEVSSPRGKKVRLRVLEYSDGLPGPPLMPRSPESYPAPESDVTAAFTDLNL